MKKVVKKILHITWVKRLLRPPFLKQHSLLGKWVYRELTPHLARLMQRLFPRKRKEKLLPSVLETSVRLLIDC